MGRLGFRFMLLNQVLAGRKVITALLKPEVAKSLYTETETRLQSRGLEFMFCLRHQHRTISIPVPVNAQTTRISIPQPVSASKMPM